MYNKKIIIAITGASGAIYAKRFFDFIYNNTDIDIRLIISDNGVFVLKEELSIDTSYFKKARVTVYNNREINVNIASGSSNISDMIIIPGSMGTVGRIAHGISNDLISRAADVILKERKRLIVVPRETPFNEIHISNLLTISKAGGIIIPASPGFYHKPSGIEALIDFVIGKVLNQMGIENHLIPEWKNS